MNFQASLATDLLTALFSFRSLGFIKNFPARAFYYIFGLVLFSQGWLEKMQWFSIITAAIILIRRFFASFRLKVFNFQALSINYRLKAILGSR